MRNTVIPSSGLGLCTHRVSYRVNFVNWYRVSWGESHSMCGQCGKSGLDTKAGTWLHLLF